MKKSQSTQSHLSLEVDYDTYAEITELKAPAIPWHYNEKEESHDWEGFLKIDGVDFFTFSAQIDDNGYIEVNGKRVLEISGDHSSTLVTGEPCLLKEGYHRIKLHHENTRSPIVQSGYPNAEVFIPMINGNPIKLYDIKVPSNLLTKEEADKILEGYRLVDYEACPQPSDVWAKFGPKATLDMAGQETCATRLSVALNLAGYDLSDEKYSDGTRAGNSIEGMGWESSIEGVSHLIFSAEVMSNYLAKKFGKEAHYTQDEMPEGKRSQDIIAFGNKHHVGMCTGENTRMGNFISGKVWILYRETWNPK